MKEPRSSNDMKLKLGYFGIADPEIVKTIGQKFYNIELRYHFGEDFIELRWVSEDALKITKKAGWELMFLNV